MHTHVLCHKLTDDCQKLNIKIYHNHRPSLVVRHICTTLLGASNVM